MNKNNAQNAAASPRLASAAQRRLGWLLVGGFVALLMYPNPVSYTHLTLPTTPYV